MSKEISIRVRPKFSIEIDLGGEECSFFHGERMGWLGWDTLVAVGDTLEQLIENATLFTQDQDGGEGPSVSLTDLNEKKMDYYISLLRDRMESAA